MYELTIRRDWLVKAAPFLKVLVTTLNLVLPVASSVTKLVLNDADFEGIEEHLDFGQRSLDSVIKIGEKTGSWMGQSDKLELKKGEEIWGQGAVLRQVHVWLKEKDPGFGGLVRVQDKQQAYLWVHPKFEKEY